MVGDGRLRITNARVPLCLLEAKLADAGEGLALVDIDIAGERIVRVTPAGATVRTAGTAEPESAVHPPPASAAHPAPAGVGRPEPEGAADEEGVALLEQDGGQVWPGFVDVHSHLDKGHIWPRAENPDGTFAAALEAVERDCAAHWSAADVRARFEFGLRCALAHGTVAIRTHLDSRPPQHRISWPLFAELRAEWAGRIDLQAASLVLPEDMAGPFGEEIADLVAAADGVLGCVTFMGPGLDAVLDRVFPLAAERGLDLDFHVDESLDPSAASLRRIAETALRHRFAGRILCGHCCALAVQTPDEVAQTLDRVAAAGIAVVSLPLCNLYLQDRAPGRTPRRRGVTLLHEMAARGIPLALASDNCRDPFYAWGDHDMLEVFREAVRIAHLDRPVGGWPAAATRPPAEVMGLAPAGRIRVGARADLVLFRARYYSELLARPQSDRIVLRAGKPIDAALPDHRALDHLFGAAGLG
jgi:cytosine deaminase